ncbi:MAG: histidinol dehydrogenase [Bacteroidota bacterium]
MKIYRNPPASDWFTILQRPLMDVSELEASVSAILQKVADQGDEAIRFYTEKFDGVRLGSIQVQAEEFAKAEEQLDQDLKDAIQTAYQNIERFHRQQQLEPVVVETMPGVRCWQRSVGIEKVGLYIPGGSAPLFSSVLMLAIPANIAGCKEIILCTPPSKDGSVHPAILYTAQLVGVTAIFKVGGAQAIGAMAYGTETVPKAYKIFGPGNQYVTAAKQLVNKSGLPIDMPAGPSEVLVLADDTANPEFVAADLLSQAEHGADSQVVLVALNDEMVERSLQAVERQLSALPRQEIARRALENSLAVVLKSMPEAIALINEYAPEHLILLTNDANEVALQIQNAGSVFIGHFTPESIGDYASGTNHTLPTNGFARSYSGVNLDAYVKKITFQEVTPTGLKQVGPVVEKMAAAEQLDAHKNAVSIRLQSLQTN